MFCIPYFRVGSIFVLLLFFLSSPSQILRGTVTDENGTPVPNASLHIKSSDHPHILSEFTFTDAKGVYEIKLSKEYDNLLLTAKAMNFEEQTIEIASPEKDKIYHHDFVLTPKATLLKEVVIKQHPIIEKKDTVVYRVDAFRDGTETKVEDLLKKLPGITVDEISGEIKFKGKPIENITLNGDDLFGKNYTIASKNINIQLVEKIEAIDNYSKNPLLKGLETEGKTSLNLKLKNQWSISPEFYAQAGYDTQLRADLAFNALILKNSFKAYLSQQYNNTGNNPFPFNYYRMSSDAETQAMTNTRLPYFTNRRVFNSAIPQERMNFNEAWYTSLNTIYRWSEKFSSKANIQFYNDRLRQFSTTNTFYTFDSTNIETSDEETFVRKPLLFSMLSEHTWNVSKKFNLVAKANLISELLDEGNNWIQNQNNQLSSHSKLYQIHGYGSIEATYRLNKNNALQFLSRYSCLKLQDDFIIQPFPNIFTTPLNGDLRQSIQAQKHFFETKTTLLGKRNHLSYKAESGFLKFSHPFIGNLSQVDGNSVNMFSSFSNDYTLKRNAFYSNGLISFPLGGLGVSSFVQVRYAEQSQSVITENYMGWDMQGDVRISYPISHRSTLQLSATRNQDFFSEDFFHNNFILADQRMYTRNLPMMELRKTDNLSLAYSYRNLKQFFSISVSGGMHQHSNNPLSDRVITPTGIGVQNTLFNGNFNGYNSSIYAEKFFPSLNANFILQSFYTHNRTFTRFSGGNLNEVNTQFLYTRLAMRTTFSGPLNFENRWVSTFFESEIPDLNSFSSNFSIDNQFKIIAKFFKNTIQSFKILYFKPDMTQSYDFWLLDYTFKYAKEKSKWNIVLSIQNILNTKIIENISIFENGFTSIRTQILPLRWMIAFNYQL